MVRGLDVSSLVSIRMISREDEKETRLLQKMANQAKLYLLSFKWCKGIKSGWLGWGVGGICGVFLFKIVPASKGVDELLWVIVGDLPPAYLVTDHASTALEALEVYVELMQEWIDSIHQGKSVEDCIPVNVPPTAEHADLLEKRLNFIRQKFLIGQSDAQHQG